MSLPRKKEKPPSDRALRRAEADQARTERLTEKASPRLAAVPDPAPAPPRVPRHLREAPSPAPWPTREQLKGAARHRAAMARVHARQSPTYAGQVARWSWAGADRALAWWWELATAPDHRALYKAASKAGDKKGRDGHHACAQRSLAWAVAAAGAALAPCLVPTAMAAVWRPLGLLAAVLVGAGWTAALALLGRRPGDRLPPPGPGPALPVTPDRILQAFGAAGFKDAATVGGARIEGKGTHRCMRVVIDLDDESKDTATDVIKKREVVAARLHRGLPCVHLTPGAHPGQVSLTVLDQDTFTVGDVSSPLLALAEFDMWEAVEIGVDFLGNIVRLPLLWTSLLVGAQPRMGKTYAMRLLCLAVALDRRSRLYLWDGKGGGDYRWFAPLCARFGQGHSTSKGHPKACLKMLREVSALVSDRNERIGRLATHLIPEGKLSPAVARDPQYDEAVGGFGGLIFVVVDELQRLIPDPDCGEEIRDELIALAQNAPSCGVILIVGTQRPTQQTGKGSLGDLPPAMGSRVAFKTMDAGESNIILGDGYAGAGWDSSKFDHGYEGVSILRSGADVESGPKGCQLVKWGRIDNGPLESKLEELVAARRAEGTLPGQRRTAPPSTGLEQAGAAAAVLERPVDLEKPDPRAAARARLRAVFEAGEDRIVAAAAEDRMGVDRDGLLDVCDTARVRVRRIRTPGGPKQHGYGFLLGDLDG